MTIDYTTQEYLEGDCPFLLQQFIRIIPEGSLKPLIPQPTYLRFSESEIYLGYFRIIGWEITGQYHSGCSLEGIR